MTSTTNKIISVQLNDKQQKQYEDWCGHIRALRGDVGTLTWKLTSHGIGSIIKVYSEDLKLELDLTDVESW